MWLYFKHLPGPIWWDLPLPKPVRLRGICLRHGGPFCWDWTNWNGCRPYWLTIGSIWILGSVFGKRSLPALGRIYHEKALIFTVEADPAVRFQGEKQDLEEMLGNLLDNASKWAATKVVLTARLEDSTDDGRGGSRVAVIRVEDDGPGIDDEQLAEPVKRGRRLDETKPGSGLGHSIVADLVQSYRGTFRLDKAELGGLSARLDLPAA